MATFFSDLFNSIFTPGPTPSIIVATNASFAALQVVLLLLLIATYSVHFVILSFLSAGLWWSINWFARELEASSQREMETKHPRETETQKRQDNPEAEDSGTETEGAGNQSERGGEMVGSRGLLVPDDGAGELRKRTSLGDASSGDMSTDSEWDKVEEAGDFGT